MARAVGDTPRFPRFPASMWLAAAALALAGCQLGLPGTGAAPGARPAAAGASVEQEVEAPEVFAAEETGLWDGRPSLGGIWVAHPGATDPERVVIRNAETGASVTGALFRRERDNPGPLFQISSEAANALGILPGAPTPIRVTALRRAEVAAAPEPAEAVAETQDEPGAEPAAAAGEAPAPRPAGLRGFFQRLRPSPPAVAEPATRAAGRAAAVLR